MTRVDGRVGGGVLDVVQDVFRQTHMEKWDGLCDDDDLFMLNGPALKRDG